MDVCGMAVAMLKPYGLLHCIVKVFCPYHSEDRHHQLCCDQRMLLRPFKSDTSDIVRNRYADHAQQCLCVTSHTFSVLTSVFEYYRYELVLLFLGS